LTLVLGVAAYAVWKRVGGKEYRSEEL
jgi:hypothetical protein